MITSKLNAPNTIAGLQKGTPTPIVSAESLQQQIVMAQSQLAGVKANLALCLKNDGSVENAGYCRQLQSQIYFLQGWIQTLNNQLNLKLKKSATHSFGGGHGGGGARGGSPYPLYGGYGYGLYNPGLIYCEKDLDGNMTCDYGF